MNESGRDEAECCRKVASVRRFAGAISSLLNARGLQLECARIFHESLLVPVLMYGSEKMIRNGLGVYRWTTSEVC